MNKKEVTDETLFDDVVLLPIAQASKYDDLAHIWSMLGVFTFFISILLLLSDGIIVATDFPPTNSGKYSANRNLASSVQSFSSHTGAKGLKNK